MAHFVQTQQKLQSRLVLSIPCRQIVMPKYRRLLRKSASQSKHVQQQIYKEHFMLRSLCEKLTQKQLKKLQIQNDANLKKKFRQIKKKIRNQALSKQRDSQVLKYLEGKDTCQDLSSLLLKSDIKNVEIGLKYQCRLTNKIISIRQTSEVDDLKDKYRSWLNTTNNSPLKSPNYNKMNFVIEKISKNKQLSQMLKNQVNLYSLKTFNVNKENIQKSVHRSRLIRTSDNTGGYANPILTHKLSTPEYSPKSKCSTLFKKIQQS